MKRDLFFCYQWLIAFPILLVATILTALITIIGCSIGNADVWGYYPGKYWSRLFCWILFCPVEVKGREFLEPQTSYVFVANHQGAFDIFLIYGYLNRSFKWLMKKELENFPFVGQACKSAGHVFVDNSTPSKTKETIEEAKQRIHKGVSVVVFPEGARTLDGKIKPFKKGAFQIAVDLDLQVVPMTIDGPFQIMKRNTTRVYPHKMVLTIHQPIFPNKESQQPLNELRDYSQAMVSSVQ